MLSVLTKIGEQVFGVELNINPHRQRHMALVDYLATFDLGEDAVGEIDTSHDVLYQLDAWTSSVGHYTWLGQDLAEVIAEAALHFGVTLPS